MQIKLYSENDTRPVGTYEYACSAYVSPFTINFVSQTGVQILSNLRYKLTLDPGDEIKHERIGQTYEVSGVTKKEFDRLVAEAEQEKLNAKHQKSTKPSAAVPPSSSSSRQDCGEKPGVRTIGKTRRGRDNGAQGRMFSDDSPRID